MENLLEFSPLFLALWLLKVFSTDTWWTFTSQSHNTVLTLVSPILFFSTCLLNEASFLLLSSPYHFFLDWAYPSFFIISWGFWSHGTQLTNLHQLVQCISWVADPLALCLRDTSHTHALGTQQISRNQHCPSSSRLATSKWSLMTSLLLSI